MYLCSRCGLYQVKNPGEICSMCALNEPAPSEPWEGGSSAEFLDLSLEEQEPSGPFQSHFPSQDFSEGGGGTSPDPFGRMSQSVTREEPLLGVSPLACGVARSVCNDDRRHSFIIHWYRSLIHGVPFPLSAQITSMQIYPDLSGSELNASGFICDQVIVPGKIVMGSISDNNIVEVYGYRDHRRYIIARKLVNRATGVTILPQETISAAAVRILTALVLVLLNWLLSGEQIISALLTLFILVILFHFSFVVNIATAGLKLLGSWLRSRKAGRW